MTLRVRSTVTSVPLWHLRGRVSAGPARLRALCPDLLLPRSATFSESLQKGLFSCLTWGCGCQASSPSAFVFLSFFKALATYGP